jgi:RNA polymerase sigma factor (sigma-70 family)
VISADELARLWREHAAALALLCRGYGVPPEDFIQEAFIRLAAQNPIPDEPLAWLVRVVRNQAISAVRHEGRRKQREQIWHAEQADWFTSNPNELERFELAADIQHALQQLDEPVREVVIAHIWGNLTFRQIAAAFGMSKSTAARLFQQGLDQLKNFLALPDNQLTQP